MFKVNILVLFENINNFFLLQLLASTLGSLEALLEFLKTSNIPVSGINIGPVNKEDVMKSSVMLEKSKEYAVILAFDVKVSKEARSIADEMGVKIFTADIIYHLFDNFTAYTKKLAEDKKENAVSLVACVFIQNIFSTNVIL